MVVTDDPCEYQTYLRSRPPQMEVAAIQLVTQLCSKYRYTFHEQAHTFWTEFLERQMNYQNMCSSGSNNTGICTVSKYHLLLSFLFLRKKSVYEIASCLCPLFPFKYSWINAPISSNLVWMSCTRGHTKVIIFLITYSVITASRTISFWNGGNTSIIYYTVLRLK